MSHEAIYRSLFIQARGVLKKELIAHLRTRRTLRHARRAEARDELRGRIPDAVSIRDRPAEVEDRAIPGHWEGDMISGSKNSHIVTLVERQSRYTALVKVKNKQTATVVAALTRQIRKLPTSLRRSLTWDRGHEMSKHKAFTVATNVKVVLLRSVEPVAAWVEREYERAAAPILSERNGFVWPYPVRSRQSRAASESTTARDIGGFETPAARLRDSVALTR